MEGKLRTKKKPFFSFSTLKSKLDERSNHPQPVLLELVIYVGTSMKKHFLEQEIKIRKAET